MSDENKPAKFEPSEAFKESVKKFIDLGDKAALQDFAAIVAESSEINRAAGRNTVADQQAVAAEGGDFDVLRGETLRYLKVAQEFQAFQLAVSTLAKDSGFKHFLTTMNAGNLCQPVTSRYHDALAGLMKREGLEPVTVSVVINRPNK